MCAVSGVLVMSIPIPIIVENFQVSNNIIIIMHIDSTLKKAISINLALWCFKGRRTFNGQAYQKEKGVKNFTSAYGQARGG